MTDEILTMQHDLDNLRARIKELEETLDPDRDLLRRIEEAKGLANAWEKMIQIAIRDYL